MARREVWVGSLGPFLYDDETYYEHENSSFTGKTRRGLATDQIRLGRNPQFPEEAVRHDDPRLGLVKVGIEFTDEGGLGIRLLNRTGWFSIPGTVVSASPIGDEGVVLCGSSDLPIGVVYDAVPDGEAVLVLIAGVADVLVLDHVIAGDVVCCAVTSGYARMSDYPGKTRDLGIAITSPGMGTARVILQLGVRERPISVEQVFGDDDVVVAEDEFVWGK